MRRPDERGVALLTVLLLVAVMSVMSVGVLDDIRFAIRRTTNAESMGQARWYALGGEALARRSLSAPSGESVLSAEPIRYPVEGGQVVVRIADGAACFNLNSVVTAADPELVRNEIGVRQFEALLGALGVGEAEAKGLAAAVTDWIDTDQTVEPGGAEDSAYGGYRTAGALMAEPSELRAVRGVTPQLYQRIRPYLCALPTAALSPINVNALTREQAPLIAMLGDGRLTAPAAARLLAERPPGGWPDLDSFWAQFAAIDVAPDEPVRAQVQLQSRVFAVETAVTFGDAEVVATSLLEMQAGGTTRLIARRWGPAE